MKTYEVKHWVNFYEATDSITIMCKEIHFITENKIIADGVTIAFPYEEAIESIKEII